MAITGKFLADFTSFYDAAQRATVSLRSFETGANRVEKSLNAMVDSFSGRKVIQDASLMVQAVDRIGGTSKLTTAEMERLRSTVSDATAKMRAMGMEVPAGFTAITESATKTRATFGEIATAVGIVGGAVAGLAASVASLGERGAGVADVRQSFQDLTGAIGESSEVMLTRLREATLGTMSNFDLMKTVNLGLSQGLKLTSSQMGEVGDVAAVLADRVGIDTSQAFETLIQAMATGQDRTLKTIGLNIDAAAATERYAASLGKATKDLTEAEQKQAIQNAILEEGRRVLALSGKAQKDFGDQVAGSRATLSNFIDTIGVWISTTPSIGAFASAITAVSSTVTALGLAWGPVTAGITRLLPLLSTAGLAGAFAAVSTAATGLVASLAALAPFLGTAGIIAAGIGSWYVVFKNLDVFIWAAAEAWTGLKNAAASAVGAITNSARAIYEGVRAWLVDRFVGIMQTVQGYISTIIGWWQNMVSTVSRGFSVGQLGISGGLGGVLLPSFAHGGVGDFGSGTMAMLHGREAIIPLDGPNKFGGITINVNVAPGFEGPGAALRNGQHVSAAVENLLRRRGVIGTV